jgi:hypothetical protein
LDVNVQCKHTLCWLQLILFGNTARANLFLAERCTKGGPSDIHRRSWLGLKPRGHAGSVDRGSMSSRMSPEPAGDDSTARHKPSPV